MNDNYSGNLDRDLEAPLHSALQDIVRELPDESPSMAWRSGLNDQLRAIADRRRSVAMVALIVRGDTGFDALDDYALASRLSYFLWSTMPDSELLAAAAKGDLAKPAALRAQVERMLNHPKARAFTEDFTGQWLALRNIEFTTPDARLYPEFDELLQVSMVQETHAFFDELLEKDLSVLNFVESDFAMLNERLAKHYRVPGVSGLDVRRVTLRPEWHRGGVMTHASVLKVTANGTSTSPVSRGVADPSEAVPSFGESATARS